MYLKNPLRILKSMHSSISPLLICSQEINKEERNRHPINFTGSQNKLMDFEGTS